MPSDAFIEQPAFEPTAPAEPALDLNALRTEVEAEDNTPLDLNALRQEVDQEETAKNDHLRALFDLNITKEPNKQAGIVRLAQDTGVPADAVEQRYDEFKRTWEAAQFDPAKWRQQNPEHAKMLLENPDLQGVAFKDQKVPWFTRKMREFTAVTDIWNEEIGYLETHQKEVNAASAAGMKDSNAPELQQQVGQAEVRSLIGDARLEQAGAETESRRVREDPAVAGMSALERTFYAPYQTFKQSWTAQEHTDLWNEILMRDIHGQDSWDLRKKAADMQKALIPTDFGDPNTLQSILTTTAEIAPSQLDVMKGAGVAGAVGFVGGGLLGSTLTESNAGALQMATAGANLLGRLGAMRVSFKKESGSAYADLQDARTDAGDPIDPGIAQAAALTYGAVAAAIETLSFGSEMAKYGPVGELLKAGPKAFLREMTTSGALRRLAKSAVASIKNAGEEGLEEVLQAVAKDVFGYYAKSATAGEIQHTEMLSSVDSALREGASAVVGTLTLNAATGPIVSVPQELSRHQAAQRSGERIAALAKIVDSPMTKAAPAAVARMAEESSKVSGEPLTHIYIDPAAFTQLFQQHGADPSEAATELMGKEGPTLLQTAIATGQRLEVPVADYLSKWGNKPIAEALAPFTATLPGVMTEAERAERVAEIEVHAQAIAKEAGEGAVPLGSEAEFATHLEEQLVDTGVYDKAKARTAVDLQRALIRTQAARFGIPADLLFSQNLINVTGPGQQVGYRPLVSPENARASIDLAQRLEKMTPEQRAAEFYLDPVTGLQHARAFEATPVPAGKRVAVITSPTIKPINDAPDAGGHHVSDNLLRTMGKALFDAGHTEAARAGTNLLVHVDDDAELVDLLERVNEAVGNDAVKVYGNLGESREAAQKALDADVDAARKEGMLPERKASAKDIGLDVGALKFAEDRAAATVPQHLIERTRTLSPEGYFREAYVDKDTGLLSALGWEAIPRKAHVAAFDLRGLKAINDRYGKDKGNEYLQHFGQLAHDLLGHEFDFAHLHGDEYAAQHDDLEALKGLVDLLNAEAHNVVLPFREKDGSITPVHLGFRYGLGERSYEAADADLNRRKRSEGEAQSADQHGGVREADGSGGGVHAVGDRDPGSPGVASRREALRRRARSQGFPGSGDAVAFQEAAVAIPEAASLTQARKFIGRMKLPERRKAARAWFDYATGRKQERPSDVPESIRRALAKFGVVDPETGGADLIDVSIDSSMRRGKRFEEEPASLREHRMRSEGTWHKYEQPAFHGSPHRFRGRFSLSKIGTGEGAQIRGWGLYFAGHKDVGEAYRHALSRPDIGIKGREKEELSLGEREALGAISMQMMHNHKLTLETALPLALKELRRQAELWGGAAKRAKDEGRALEEFEQTYVDAATEGLAAMERIGPDGFEQRRGQLYEVDLPENDRLIDSEKSLGQQPDAVKAALAAMPSDIRESLEAYLEDHDQPTIEDLTGRELYELLVRDASEGGGAISAAVEGAENMSAPEIASRFLGTLGIPGLRFLDQGSRNKGEGTYNFVIWDENAIGEPTTYYQPPGSGEGGGGHRGYVKFARAGMKRIFNIVLDKNADLSTFLHESGHVFLELMGDLAERPDAPAKLREDYAQTLKWLGVEKRSEISEDHHEKWARTFEAYLREGQTPSAKLRLAFERFRLWLKVIYKSITSLRADLNPDIKGVFDRLLATDEEISRAEERMGLRPIYRSPEEMGVSPETYQAYLDEMTQGRSHAERTTEMRMLKDRLRETERVWKDEEVLLREKALEAYELLPARVAQLLLRGKQPGDAKTVLSPLIGAPTKLDRDAVVAAVGKEAARKFKTTEKDGVHPDTIALQVGFPTGEAMLKAISTLPEKEQWAAQQAAEQMKDRHPDILDEKEKLAELVEKATHNPYNAKWLYREWAALRAKAYTVAFNPEANKHQAVPNATLGKDPSGPPPIESLQRAAELIAEKTKIRALNAGRALNAERSAADKAAKAAAGGNYVQAFMFKQQQLISMFLHRALTEAREDREKLLDLASDLRKNAARQKMGKANPAFVDGVDSLLEAIGLRKPEATGERKSLDEVVAALEAASGTVMFDVDALRKLLAEPREWRDLSVGEMRNVLTALKNIKATASARNNAIVDGKHMEQDQIAEQLIAEVLTNYRDQGPAVERIAQDRKRRWWSTAAGWDAAMTKPEVFLRAMGGGGLGSMWHRAFVQTLQDAKAREADILKEAIAPVIAAFEAIPEAARKRAGEAIDGEALFPGHRGDLKPPSTRVQLMMMALNAGNQSNLHRLLEGRGITPEQLRTALNLLTKEEMDWVQSIWDANEKLWPLARELEERDSGLAPPKIERTPLALASGTYAGGYVPAVYLREVENQVAQRQMRSLSDFTNPAYVRPGTPHSHLKSRVENFSGALALDPSIIYSHFAQVAHDIAFREAVKSTAGLLLRDDVQAALKRTIGVERTEMLLTWLKDVGTMRGSQIDAHAGALNRVMRKLKGNTAVSVLGWALSTPMGDFSNLAVAALDLEKGHWFKAMTDYVSHPLEMDAFAHEKSGEMRARRGDLQRELHSQISRLTEKGLFALRPMAFYRDHAFVFMETTDRITSVPIWHAAFEQAKGKGESEEDAIRFADSVIRDNFPSHSAVDKAELLRDKGFWGASTSMFGYFSTMWAKERALIEPIIQAEGAIPTAKALARASGRLMALWISFGVLGELLTGRGPEASDGDSPEERWANWFIRKLLAAPLSTLPLPLAQTYESLWKGKKASIRGAPMHQLFEAFAKAVIEASKEDHGDKAIMELARGLGMMLGVPIRPLTTQADYLLGLATGNTEAPRNPADLVGGLIYGQRPNQPANIPTIIGDAISGER